MSTSPIRNEFIKLLQRAVQKDASDIHLKTGSPPYFRINGELASVGEDAIYPETMSQILNIMMTDEQLRVFSQRGELDFAFSEKGVGRFRVNVFRQRGTISCVMRRIKTRIQSFEELCLPPQVVRFAELQRGLILIAGTTGSGKSTTLAAITEYINQNRACHIITIEDPIEFIHVDKKSVINQREISIDTHDFNSALKTVMRQDPDVIIIGEMRDHETFMAAVSAAETGHLVFSTLHTTNIMQTIDRIIDFFPSNQHDQVRSQLSMNLKAIMCMRLLPRADGRGRVPACEILFNTPIVRKLIKENRISQLDTAIQQGREEGMQTFNDSLFQLVRNSLITLDMALDMSDNPEELQMMLQGIRLSNKRGGILK
ncbi:MAG: type IV pilus twitching motility protein PilT [Candidatus Hydrogenedens sp.]|nr:type IV pilus twitching motility protein PilT [Candidatus Hydrogenedens sp.]